MRPPVGTRMRKALLRRYLPTDVVAVAQALATSAADGLGHRIQSASCLA